MSASTLMDLVRPINWPRMRPRFVVEVSCSVDQVTEALRAGIALEGDWIEGQLSERLVNLSVGEQERQFWSTRLGLEIEEVKPPEAGDQGVTRVFGIFSPQPEIWTAYVFIIGTLMGIGAFGLLWSIVQLSMGNAPWAALVSLIATLLGGLVYTSTLVGQGLALGEMYRLRRYVDDRLGEAEQSAEQALGEPISSL